MAAQEFILYSHIVIILAMDVLQWIGMDKIQTSYSRVGLMESYGFGTYVTITNQLKGNFQQQIKLE